MQSHILRTQQFNRRWLDEFFAETTKLRELFLSGWKGREEIRTSLKGRLMFTLFCEPSTRTRFSFESAAHHLGMGFVSTENGGEFSSLIKGESMEHMIEVLCRYYPDVIVLRHKEEGVTARVAPIASKHGVLLVNAGDGIGQHPTQALLDVYTINSIRGSVDDMTVVVGGDLTYGRTSKSLVYLLSKYHGVKFIFVSPKQLKMSPGVITHLHEHMIPFREVSVDDGNEIADVIREADVVYWTRTQAERIPDADERKAVAELAPRYQITLEHAQLLEERKGILLHPLPINVEVVTAVDSVPCAKYFEQSGNGLFIRMALLQAMLIND